MSSQAPICDFTAGPRILLALIRNFQDGKDDIRRWSKGRIEASSAAAYGTISKDSHR